MSMNATTLGNAMATAVGVSGNAAATASFVAIAGAIIAHITANAVVTVSTSDTITTLQLATTVCAAVGSPLTGTIATTGTGTGTIA